tara:strand:- start:3909 stop:4136 length:228 start_codon:yes stop_codon:yes gene_type:complete
MKARDFITGWEEDNFNWKAYAERLKTENVQLKKELNEVKKLNIDDVSKSLCDVCGSDDVAEYPHVGFTCYTCNPM